MVKLIKKEKSIKKPTKPTDKKKKTEIGQKESKPKEIKRDKVKVDKKIAKKEKKADKASKKPESKVKSLLEKPLESLGQLMSAKELDVPLVCTFLMQIGQASYVKWGPSLLQELLKYTFFQQQIEMNSKILSILNDKCEILISYLIATQLKKKKTKKDPENFEVKYDWSELNNVRDWLKKYSVKNALIQPQSDEQKDLKSKLIKIAEKIESGKSKLSKDIAPLFSGYIRTIDMLDYGYPNLLNEEVVEVFTEFSSVNGDKMKSDVVGKFVSTSLEILSRTEIVHPFIEVLFPKLVQYFTADVFAEMFDIVESKAIPTQIGQEEDDIEIDDNEDDDSQDEESQDEEKPAKKSKKEESESEISESEVDEDEKDIVIPDDEPKNIKYMYEDLSDLDDDEMFAADAKLASVFKAKEEQKNSVKYARHSYRKFYNHVVTLIGHLLSDPDTRDLVVPKWECVERLCRLVSSAYKKKTFTTADLEYPISLQFSKALGQILSKPAIWESKAIKDHTEIVLKVLKFMLEFEPVNVESKIHKKRADKDLDLVAKTFAPIGTAKLVIIGNAIESLKSTDQDKMRDFLKSRLNVKNLGKESPVVAKYFPEAIEFETYWAAAADQHHAVLTMIVDVLEAIIKKQAVDKSTKIVDKKMIEKILKFLIDVKLDKPDNKTGTCLKLNRSIRELCWTMIKFFEATKLDVSSLKIVPKFGELMQNYPNCWLKHGTGSEQESKLRVLIGLKPLDLKKMEQERKLKMAASKKEKREKKQEKKRPRETKTETKKQTKNESKKVPAETTKVVKADKYIKSKEQREKRVEKRKIESVDVSNKKKKVEVVPKESKELKTKIEKPINQKETKEVKAKIEKPEPSQAVVPKETKQVKAKIEKPIVQKPPKETNEVKAKIEKPKKK